MADLTDSIASNSRIQELQKELKQLKTYVSGPKYLYDQSSKVYALDPGAYYDPTLEDKGKRIKYLEGKIAELTEQMRLNIKMPEFEIKDVEKIVQNYTNKNKEETNGFISRSYYYPVGNSPPSVAEKDTSLEPANPYMNNGKGHHHEKSAPTNSSYNYSPKIVDSITENDKKPEEVKPKVERAPFKAPTHLFQAPPKVNGGTSSAAPVTSAPVTPTPVNSSSGNNHNSAKYVYSSEQASEVQKNHFKSIKPHRIEKKVKKEMPAKSTKEQGSRSELESMGITNEQENNQETQNSNTNTDTVVKAKDSKVKKEVKSQEKVEDKAEVPKVEEKTEAPKAEKVGDKSEEKPENKVEAPKVEEKVDSNEMTNSEAIPTEQSAKEAKAPAAVAKKAEAKTDAAETLAAEAPNKEEKEMANRVVSKEKKHIQPVQAVKPENKEVKQNLKRVESVKLANAPQIKKSNDSKRLNTQGLKYEVIKIIH